MLINIYNHEFKDLQSHKKGLSEEDRIWTKKIETTCATTRDGHYELSLPFRDLEPRFPNNKGLAVKRIQSLKRKFSKDQSYLKEYSKYMSEILEKGHAEAVKECITEEGKVWYIPHHSVYHPQKPDKIRVVFDCAAKFKGRCLNDSLLQGPDLASPLVEVLIKFRQGPYAFMADIESMFYQIKVPVKDRDYLRFLWWPDKNFEIDPVEYRMTVHIFGANSSPSCANYALQKTAMDYGNEDLALAKHTILNNFYVDDCLKSTDTETQLVKVAHDVQTLCKKGGFNLTKYVSNSRCLLQSFPEDHHGKNVKVIDLCKDILPSV